MFQNIIFALLVVLFYLLPAHATIITVDNGANSGGQYTDIQMAVDNASAGDTIHVIGSNTSYGNLTLNKRLTLIGAGYNPPTQFGLNSQLTSITLSQISPGTSAAGSKITGFKINSITWTFNAVLDNITIERCEVTSSIAMANANSSGWVIQHNILWSVSIGNNSNCVIRNNIIEGPISISNEPSVLITNNIFTYVSISGNAFSNVQHAVIANNIFYKSRTPQGAQFCTFNNNITYQTSNDTLPYGNNSGSGNLITVDPMFSNAPNAGFDYMYDYRLATGSQGIGSGTDNTNIGIYGSTIPFPLGGPAPHLTSPPPAVPQVIEFDLLNANLSQGDPLQFHIKARKQN